MDVVVCTWLPQTHTETNYEHRNTNTSLGGLQKSGLRTSWW